jgi:hypothetical protein
MEAAHSQLISQIDEALLKGRSEWYHFGKYINLYHGTSSLVEKSIRKNGLKPPSLDLKELATTLALQYAPNRKVPDDVIDESIKAIRSIRPGNNELSAVYLTNGIGTAWDYAEAYAKTFGEIGSDVWREYVSYAMRNSLTDLEKQLRVTNANGKPIVVEVRVPTKWAKSWYNLKKVYREIKRGSIDDQERKNWLASKGGMEFRVHKTIPAVMVRRVYYTR